VDDALLDLLERATHKQFMYRYKTAQEFRRALAALGTDAADLQARAGGVGPVDAVAPRRERSLRRPVRRPG